MVLSYPNNISDKAIKYSVLNHANYLLNGFHLSTTFIGPWAVSDYIILTLFVDRNLEMKRTKLFRYIESTTLSFLSSHLSESAPYLSLYMVRADEVQELDKGVKAMNSGIRYRNHTYARKLKMAQAQQSEFIADVTVKIKGISNRQGNFTSIVSNVFNSFSQELIDELKTSDKFLIQRANIRSSANHSFYEDDSHIGNGHSNPLTSKLALMFYIEGLLVLLSIYIVYIVRKIRKKHRPIDEIELNQQIQSTKERKKEHENIEKRTRKKKVDKEKKIVPSEQKKKKTRTKRDSNHLDNLEKCNNKKKDVIKSVVKVYPNENRTVQSADSENLEKSILQDPSNKKPPNELLGTTIETSSSHDTSTNSIEENTKKSTRNKSLIEQDKTKKHNLKKTHNFDKEKKIVPSEQKRKKTRTKRDSNNGDNPKKYSNKKKDVIKSVVKVYPNENRKARGANMEILEKSMTQKSSNNKPSNELLGTIIETNNSQVISTESILKKSIQSETSTSNFNENIFETNNSLDTSSNLRASKETYSEEIMNGHETNIAPVSYEVNTSLESRNKLLEYFDPYTPTINDTQDKHKDSDGMKCRLELDSTKNTTIEYIQIPEKTIDSNRKPAQEAKKIIYDDETSKHPMTKFQIEGEKLRPDISLERSSISNDSNKDSKCDDSRRRYAFETMTSFRTIKISNKMESNESVSDSGTEENTTEETSKSNFRSMKFQTENQNKLIPSHSYQLERGILIKSTEEKKSVHYEETESSEFNDDSSFRSDSFDSTDETTDESNSRDGQKKMEFVPETRKNASRFALNNREETVKYHKHPSLIHDFEDSLTDLTDDFHFESNDTKSRDSIVSDVSNLRKHYKYKSLSSYEEESEPSMTEYYSPQENEAKLKFDRKTSENNQDRLCDNNSFTSDLDKSLTDITDEDVYSETDKSMIRFGLKTIQSSRALGRNYKDSSESYSDNHSTSSSSKEKAYVKIKIGKNSFCHVKRKNSQRQKLTKKRQVRNNISEKKRNHNKNDTPKSSKRIKNGTRHKSRGSNRRK